MTYGMGESCRANSPMGHNGLLGVNKTNSEHNSESNGDASDEFTGAFAPRKLEEDLAAEVKKDVPEAKEKFDRGSNDALVDSSAQGLWSWTPSSSCKVAVIGAGAAGLVAARELVREGHEVVIFEEGQEVGGVWQYDERVESDPLGIDPNRSRVHSSIYKSLRVNLPRETMGYLDYPFLPREGEGRDSRRFCSHKEVLLYLKDFAEDYNLVKLVRFGVKVDFVGQLKANKAKWVVKFGQSDDAKAEKVGAMAYPRQMEQESEVFDAVVVCCGHYSQARVVHIPGVESWPGLQIHSHNYRSPHLFQDQVVVVIGSASSGEDITREVAELAKEVHQSARAWNSIELPTSGEGPQHNVWRHPMVERACADGTVKFQDGASVVADVILHCTGYMYTFPFLDTEGYVSVDDNRVGPLYKHVFPPALAPTLSFIGLCWKVAPFPLMELQASWIVRVLSGKTGLPSESEMMADVRNLYDRLEAEHMPKSYSHNCAGYLVEYGEWLAEQSGRRPAETWRREIYLANTKNRIANPGAYRDEWQDQDWADVAMACLETIKFPKDHDK